MATTQTKIEVYLEEGGKRTIAAAVAWPGWCRIGRDEHSALEALAAYGVRYGQVAHAAHLHFKAPADASAFTVVERLKGGSTTDFGAPEAIPACDDEPLTEADVRRLRALLHAAWRTFDKAVAAAQGKTLRKGPRGGGRDLDHIIEHVLGADGGHLSRIGRKFVANSNESLNQQLANQRVALLDALEAGAHGEIPARGPRGGKRAPVRFVIRRSLWHLLDHVWETEDRAEEAG